MTARDRPPFRADHVGSLLRPEKLLDARDDFAAGRITAAELRAVEDEAIAGAVRMQQEAGLRSATDGEFRRASWHMDFIYRLGGVSKAPGHLAVRFRNPSGTIEFTPAALHIDGKIRLDETIFGDDFGYLRSIAGDSVPKLTIPASTPTSRSSGRTCPPPTPSRSAAWPRPAAPTCSSTTPAWRT
jgi:5-methyltetrahydropteroyltriglutamate--homocysteine methyltransferase